MANKTIDVKVKSTVELNELRKMEDAIQREIVQLNVLGNKLDEITAKEKELAAVRAKIDAIPLSKQAGATLTDAVNSVPGAGPVFQAIKGSLLGITALTYGAHKAFSIAGQSIRAFAASEVEMAKLDSALANSGHLTDAYREKLSKLATERSGKTGIADEKYVAVLATLTKFGANTGNIKQYLRAVENLAGFIGGDLEQSAFLFGKAMQGSTEMLGRYGISVDSAKDKSEQLADIMRQLEERGGGQLEAMADGVQGSFNKLSNAWENMLESLGSLAAKSGFAKFLNWSAEKIQVAADFYAGERGSKLENREVLVGTTDEEQKAADEISIQRKQMEAARAFFASELEKAEKALNTPERPIISGVAGGGIAMPKSSDELRAEANYKKNQESRVSLMRANIAVADKALADLDAKAKDMSLRRVTPAEAAKEAEIRALRVGTVELGPGGDAGAREAARIAAEKQAKEDADLAARREELDLELRIAEARASGNRDMERKLKWQQDYTRLLKEAQAVGMEDPWGYAQRGANAAMGGKAKDIGPGIDTSNLGAAQTAMLAKMAMGAVPKADKMSDIAKNTSETNTKLDALITAVNSKDTGVFT